MWNELESGARTDADVQSQRLDDGRAALLREYVGDLPRQQATGEMVQIPANPPLFEHPDNPLQDVTLRNVRQGQSLGDCYFMATLAGLAQTNPQLIVNMIEDNKDGTYTVTFPGMPFHPQTVARPSGASLKENAGYGGGTWANVIEMAHRKLTGKWSSLAGGNWTVENGGTLSDGMQLLTGNFSHTGIPKQPEARDELSRYIESALGQGRVITAAATVGGIAETSQPSVCIQSPHAYTVVGFDELQKRVILRNPWGYNNSGEDTDSDRLYATFSMSLDEFQKHFAEIATGSVRIASLLQRRSKR